MAACVDAFIADEVPVGKSRTRMFAHFRTVQTMGRACGPLFQTIVVWICLNNEWPTETSSSASSAQQAALRGAICIGFTPLLAIMPLCWLLREPPPARAAAAGFLTAAAGPSWPHSRICGLRLSWLVPFIVEVFSLMFMVGAGNTLKFFPVFFKVDYGLSPAGVCAVMTTYWIVTALGSQIALPLSALLGRPLACLLLHSLGTVLLYAMCFFRSLWLVLPIFLVRPGLINATFPMNSSLVFDAVKPEHRGRWAALQSLRRMTWSGSAYIGGLISDKHDFRYAFVLTAHCFVLAGAVYSPLTFLVPDRRPTEAS
eukprot:gnl/TRDRNA2_/TRDRNA2_125899_c0_seq1.p1 gnl/TRDRNA2_/TRDRNA2_125899_c0~~gnl/TRDRNA2_/TRDRNA2_125899_c0_seq1.p1  ORF type:complete len:356 (+),score=35.63 gnl/TRDRNA2_/TRDRNA2_125899_c0_seq1:130-1068(+)